MRIFGRRKLEKSMEGARALESKTLRRVSGNEARYSQVQPSDVDLMERLVLDRTSWWGVVYFRLIDWTFSCTQFVCATVALIQLIMVIEMSWRWRRASEDLVEL